MHSINDRRPEKNQLQLLTRSFSGRGGSESNPAAAVEGRNYIGDNRPTEFLSAGVSTDEAGWMY